MRELTGSIRDMCMDFKTGKAIVSLSVNEKHEAMKWCEELQNEDKLSIKIGKFRKRRSLNANAYAWKLIGEIGNALLMSKEDVYLMMLKRYGQSEMISVLSHIPIQDYIRYSEEAGESILNGKTFTHYKVYKGSSDFDTKEMSIFIDGIVDEAKQLGIQTETPDEIARLKSLWSEEEKQVG